VEIIDQGRGIPDFVKRKLGKHEFTYGKQSGIGIGLSHAFQTIEDWGGKIEIQDSYPQGTRVKISLRKAPVPSWFLSQLTLREGMHIVMIGLYMSYGGRNSLKFSL
jgi:signal transduction histidine kinase